MEQIKKTPVAVAATATVAFNGGCFLEQIKKTPVAVAATATVAFNGAPYGSL